MSILIFKWIAYGLDMKDDIVREVEGKDIYDSHYKMLDYLNENKIPFDTCQLYEEKLNIKKSAHKPRS